MKCRICENKGLDSFYIGSTGKKVKQRVREHYYEARAYFKHNKLTDSFVHHIKTGHFLDFEDCTMEKLRDSFTLSLLRQMEIRNASTPNCNLCQQERFEIFRARRVFGHKVVMNKHEELSLWCRHKSEFVL